MCLSLCFYCLVQAQHLLLQLFVLPVVVLYVVLQGCCIPVTLLRLLLADQQRCLCSNGALLQRSS
jgi:hypothetical protein